MRIRIIDEAVECLYDLDVSVIGTDSSRHERRTKPLLILAALDLIGSGDNRTGRSGQVVCAGKIANDRRLLDNPVFGVAVSGHELAMSSIGSFIREPTVP
jgi:hypothetical protein